jgi:hypothetical protein
MDESRNVADAAETNRWITSLSADGVHADLDWLDASYEDPAWFRSSLAEFDIYGPRPPRKSQPGLRYDLYFDLVYRHVAGGAEAFRWYEGARRWRSLTYAQLHERANARAQVWERAGMRPGQTICLIGDVGPEFLISLVTSLRMGLALSWLQPYGSRFLSHRLECLAPDFLFTEYTHLNRFLTDFPVLLPERESIVPDGGRPRNSAPSGTATVARLFSPLSIAHDKPRALSADTLYQGLLRDLFFAFDLRPGECLAAPGFDDLQWQPHLLLLCLLGGATYVHLLPEQLRNTPQLITNWPLKRLGVSPEVRDIYARRPRNSLACESWFRDPQTQHEAQAWRSFVEAQGLAEIPMSNLLMDSSAGGVILQSIRRKGGSHPWTHPAPGRAWALLDAGGSGEPAVGVTGVFAFADAAGEMNSAGFLLSRQGVEHAFVAPRPGTRRGHVYPTDELLVAVSEIEHVEGVSLVSVPDPSSPQYSLKVLLVFAPNHAIDPECVGNLRQGIESQIEALIGRRFLPDRIEIYPFYPKRDADRIDHTWCANQYRMGLLARKRSSPTHQLLTRLRTYARCSAVGSMEVV